MTGGVITGSGTTTLNGNVTAVSSGATAALISGSTLALAASGTATSRIFNITSAGVGESADLTISDTLTDGTGSNTLVKTGNGILSLSGVALSSTYTGGTQINGGVLSLAEGNALGTSGTISFGGGTLQITSSGQIDYSARFANSASAIVIDMAGATNGETFTGALNSTNTGGLTKLGLGLLKLNAIETYTGTTTITNGTLAINSNNQYSASSLLSIGSLGIFDLVNTSQVVGGLSGTGLVTNSVTNAGRLTSAPSCVQTFSGSILNGGGSMSCGHMGNHTQHWLQHHAAGTQHIACCVWHARFDLNVVRFPRAAHHTLNGGLLVTGGTLAVNGNVSSAQQQVFSSTVLGGGQSYITTTNNGANILVSLGALNRIPNNNAARLSTFHIR